MPTTYGTKLKGLRERSALGAAAADAAMDSQTSGGALPMTPVGYSVHAGGRSHYGGAGPRRAGGGYGYQQRAAEDAALRAWTEQQLKERDRGFYRGLAAQKQQFGFQADQADYGLRREGMIDEQQRRWAVSGSELSMEQNRQQFDQDMKRRAFEIGMMGTFTPETIESYMGGGALPGPERSALGALPAPEGTAGGQGQAGALPAVPEFLRETRTELDENGVPTLRSVRVPNPDYVAPSATGQTEQAPSAQAEALPSAPQYGEGDVRGLQWAPGVREEKALKLVEDYGMRLDDAAALFEIDPKTMRQRADVKANRGVDLLRAGVRPESVAALTGVAAPALALRPDTRGSGSGGVEAKDGTVVLGLKAHGFDVTGLMEDPDTLGLVGEAINGMMAAYPTADPVEVYENVARGFGVPREIDAARAAVEANPKDKSAQARLEAAEEAQNALRQRRSASMAEQGASQAPAGALPLPAGEGSNAPVGALPDVAEGAKGSGQEAEARAWLDANPNHPKAAEWRAKLDGTLKNRAIGKRRIRVVNGQDMIEARPGGKLRPLDGYERMILQRQEGNAENRETARVGLENAREYTWMDRLFNSPEVDRINAARKPR